MLFIPRKPAPRWDVQVEVGGAWTTLEHGYRVTTQDAYKLMARERLASSGRIRMQPADIRVAGEFPAVRL